MSSLLQENSNGGGGNRKEQGPTRESNFKLSKFSRPRSTFLYRTRMRMLHDVKEVRNLSLSNNALLSHLHIFIQSDI